MDPRVLGGRYELRHRLGVGGMAEVFLAIDHRLGRQVAVKLLAAAYAADRSFVERFRREARAAAAVNHPNVVAIYDWGTDGDQHYMVLEYVAGPNLRELIRRLGQIPEAESLEIAAQIAAALEAAHRRGVIHRDVKPHNVLVDEHRIGGHGEAARQVKVTDFGIARAAGAAQLTQTAVVLGTAQYISPEQAQHLPVDGRSDLYSLGIVLYEMLAGSVPFAGDSVVAVAWQQVHDPHPPLRGLRPDISAATEAVVTKVLAKDPAARFQTAAEMRAALEEVREQLVRAAAAAAATTRIIGPAVPAWPEARQAVPPPAEDAHDAAPVPDEPPPSVTRAGRHRTGLRLAALLALVLLSVAAGGAMLMRAASGPLASRTGDDGAGNNGVLAGPQPQAGASAPAPAPTETPAAPRSTATLPLPTWTPAPARPTATLPSTTPAEPMEAVLTFYRLVAQHEFDRAVPFWTPRMQAAYPPDVNIYRRFGQTQQITVERADVISLDQAAGRATVAVVLVEVTGEPPATRRWDGTWQLVRMPTGWLLDQPNF
ncbi:MAG: serine/threonine protein kinase [Chloroflexi bacterium]|nr:serine/threonine protein kinase [Chloroflexota bacterium]